MEDCVFCRLTDNQGGNILYKNSSCYALADRFPASFGHVLVIPNKHYTDLLDAPDGVLSEVFKVAKKFAVVAKEQLGADGINIAVNNGKEAGQVVFHLHVHVIPRYAGRKDMERERRQVSDSDVEKLKSAVKKSGILG